MQQLLPNERAGRSSSAYQNYLEDAIGKDNVQAILDSFAVDGPADANVDHTALQTTRFAGSLSAKIGLLLDYSMVSAAETESSF
jgi:hypothetical protein